MNARSVNQSLLRLLLAAGGLAGSSLRLDGYGLVSSLPPGYYLGLICLPLASGVQWLRGPRASTKTIVLHVVLFALIVWLRSDSLAINTAGNGKHGGEHAEEQKAHADRHNNNHGRFD